MIRDETTLQSSPTRPVAPMRKSGRAVTFSGLLTVVILAFAARGIRAEIGASELASPGVASAPASQPADHWLEVQDLELLNIEIPTVVTASRREQKVTDVPHAVSVITSEDIRRSGARSVPDAMRLVVGMDVADIAYNVFGVSPRGLHGILSREVLVLVDGREIHDALYGGTPWGAWPFQLEDIDRIEVIRGPGGVAWGANAVNGVINIITKDPADQLGLAALARGGSRGTHTEHLGYAWADEKLRIRVSGEYEGSDGYLDGNVIGHDTTDNYKGGRAAVHAIFDQSERDTFTLSLASGVVDGMCSAADLGKVGFGKSPGSQASFIMGKWNHRIAADNRLELIGYVNDYYSSIGTPQIDYRYQQLALQLSHAFAPHEHHEITWGIDTRFDLVDAGNSDPSLLSDDHVNTGIVGVYLQDKWRFAPRWALDLGGRLDYDFYGGFQPSARAGLSYELNDHSLLYGAVSRAFQIPPAAARHLNQPAVQGLLWIQADRDVAAEALVAYEIGYRARLLERLQLDANLFWHEYDDLTILRPTLGPPGLARFMFENGYDAALYGAELEARYTASEDLTLLGNYAYQILETRGPASISNTDYISPAQHKFMLGARYDATDDLHLDAYLYYVDTVKSPNSFNPFRRRTIHPYFRLDLRAEHDLWNDNASVAVGVRNLLDSGHLEGTSLFLDDAEAPRMVYAEIRVRLGK